jgi:carbon-monoxide dehydrogenase large subunit
MKIAEDVVSGLSALDRPNSYIGRSVPRPNLDRLTQGRGQYVSDVVLPRMVHVAFCVRRTRTRASKPSKPDKRNRRPVWSPSSPVPELAKVITPWVGVLTHLEGH